MNTTATTNETDDVVFDISEVCENYPDGCEFCDYNLSGWCSMYCTDVEDVEAEHD